MKKFLSILAVVLTVATVAIGQSPSPGVFNYQGVARNSVGNVLINKTISLRLTVHDGTATGATVYQESRTVITNPFGLFNVQVGSAGGTAVTGTIAGVNWGVGLKFIQVEIDPNGGSSFINIGTAQIASVPYSLYSSLSNDLVLPFLKTQADAGTLFRINNSGTGVSGAIMGTTTSTAANAWGVHGQVNNTSAGGFSSGILGTNLSTTGLGIGVTGTQAGGGWGVYGTTPSGIGVNGVSASGTGVNGSSTSGIGGNFSSTTGRALQTAGGVRLTGINEAANRILTTIPGNGDATWQSPSAVGIVTGSGTLNFVPKWTPDGTNLGNSKIFDDGTFVGVGTTTPGAGLVVSGNGIWNSAIGIQNTATGMEWRMNVSGTTFGITKIPGSTFTPLQLFSTGGMDFSSSAGTSIVRLLDNGNVGIGITAPTSRLQVTDGGTIPTASFTKTNAANTSNTLFVSDADVTTTGAFNGGIFATKGGGAVTFLNGQTVIKGFARLAGGVAISGASGAGGISVAGTTSSGIGLVGIATAPTGFGLITIGQVQIQGQNAGLNRILTSDAVGTATWQDPATVGILTGSGTLNFIPKWTPNGTTLGNSLAFDNGVTHSIGSTTPTTDLFYVSNAAANTFANINQVGANVGGLSFTRANAYKYDLAMNAANDFYIQNYTAGSTALTVLGANSNVGINQTNPSAKLDVNGTFKLTDGTQGANKVLTSDAAGNASWQAIPAGIGTITSSLWLSPNDPPSRDTSVDGTLTKTYVVLAPELTPAVIATGNVTVYFRVGSVGPYILPYISNAGGRANAIQAILAPGKIIITRPTFNETAPNNINLPATLEFRYVIIQ